MGRPGLPMSSFVPPQDEREQLMAAFAATAYERGYAATRLSDVAQRAGVPFAVVTARWPTEVDCLLDTVATSTRQLFGRMVEAFMAASGDPAEALHEALGRLLRDMAETPEMVHLSVVELPGLGPLVRERHRRMLELFCDVLGPGFAARGTALPNPEIVALCIGGGVWRMIRRRAIERRTHELPDALAAISYVCLSTFFGTDEARRVTARPVVRP
jgi:AcrR family transcriptional regulator